MDYIQEIIHRIKEDGPISKRELQVATGLSWGLISREVNKLTEQGYLENSCRETDGAGRKAEEYDISRNRNFFVGILLNYYSLSLVLTDMKARIIFQKEIPIEPSKRERNCVLSALIQELDNIFDSYRQKTICGIGIGVQGPVQREEGISAYINKIQDWRNVPLKQILEERYHVAVRVEHDVNALMENERSSGFLNCADITEAVLISLDPRAGIGMSFAVYNQLYYGYNGKAGEIGFFILDSQESEPARYLEGHILKEQIVQDYNAMYKDKHETSYSRIVEQAKSGDLAGIDIFKQLGRNIGLAVSNACSILNPQRIVFYAPLCECADIVFHEMKEVVLGNTYDKTVDIKMSALGKDAVSQGAAMTAIESAIEKM